MESIRRVWVFTFALVIGFIVPNQVIGQSDSWEPNRINRVIELWEMGEPVYYTGCGPCDYEAGLGLAQTTADYIDYGIEHTFIDIPRLREFMQGLVDGGPTPSGHRTPAVIVSTPAVGWTAGAMEANTHVMQYILAAGAHGILLTHAVDTEAIRKMVQAIRYPFAPVVDGLSRGMRGAGSAGYAASIWGVSESEYLDLADPWPMNPNGEIVLGLKLENPFTVENAEVNMRVPGIAFAEWGPGDMAYFAAAPGSGQAGRPDEQGPQMQAYRERVFNAVREVDGYFLNSCNAGNVTDMIDEGVMICTGGGNLATVETGRAHTNRQMPWR